MLTFRTILHPTDFSPNSNHAFQLACTLARKSGGRVILLHVVAPPMVGYVEGMVMPQAEPDLDQVRAQLRRVAETVPDVQMDECASEGDFAAEILRTAEDSKSDLIVMGTHGRTGIGRFLMGSVAENVLRKATCPVLTVKSPSCDGTKESSKSELASSGVMES